ncbi:hypothetical protein H5410_001932 [Solanum commersonii]|uniref:Uncharacterized protein n=1 Tax=Solanum commersonii TaxID=4109 RepID=A0A9J6B1H1_SOLCO|nr:hypothetical protein H5410_001932 [Solanum commersonii]
MSKKTVVTPQKSPLLVEGTYTDEIHAPSFNILTQTPSPNIDESDKSKGKKRKGKNVETPSDFDFDFDFMVLTTEQHLKKTKKLLGESEVIGTVASKFGGPRIAKEHVPDTTNYPTPRPHTRNLK